MTAERRTDIITLAASALFTTLVLYGLAVGQGILMPLVLAIFLTYLIVATAHLIEGLKIGSWRPPGWLALTGAIAGFMLLIALLVQIVADNVGAVVEAAPSYQARLQTLMTQINEFIANSFGQRRPLTVATLLNEIDLRAWVGRFANAFQSIAGNTVQIFAYVFFLLLERRFLSRKLDALFPDQARRETVRNTMAKIGSRIESYVWIKTLVSFLTAALSYIVLLIAGVDFAAFWSLLIFVLNFIPYVGTPIAIAFPTMLALLQFETPLTALIVGGSLIGAQFLVENVLEPRLMGKSLNLSPVAMILSLSVWAALWGITGMILAVPVMVMLMITFAQFQGTRPLAVLMSEHGNPD